MALGTVARNVASTSYRQVGRTALAAQLESSLRLQAAANSNVGCSYRVSQPTTSRAFSATSRAPFMEGIRDVFRGVTDRSKKAVGMKTTQDDKWEQYLQELEPSAEKSRKRLQRKRWSRPVLVPATGRHARKVEEGDDVIDAEERADKSTDMREVYLEHKYSTARFRISERKLQMLAHQIGGGKPLDFAIIQMQFSHKRASSRIKSMLALARDHAVAKGLDPAKLVVAEAWVGKGRTFKSIEIKGRGRFGVRKSHQAFMSVVLREGKTWDVKCEEQLEKEKRIIRSIGTGGVVRTNRPLANAHQRPAWQW